MAENAGCPPIAILSFLVYHVSLIQEGNTPTSKTTFPTTVQPDVANKIAELLCGTLGSLFKENCLGYKGCPFTLLPVLLFTAWKVNVMFGTLSAILDCEKSFRKNIVS